MVHPVVGSIRDRHDGVVPQPQHGRRFADAEVAVLRSEDTQLVQQARQPEGLVAGQLPQSGDCVVAGNKQRLEVRLASAGREHAVGRVAEGQPLRGPVDEAALDHGGAGALVPGVHGGIHGGQDALPHQRRDDHGAVQVGRVLRVVEVDGILQVDLFKFSQRGSGVRQRCAQVDGGDAFPEFAGSDAGERFGGPLQFGGHGGDALEDLGHVARRIAGVEQVVGGGEGELHPGAEVVPGSRGGEARGVLVHRGQQRHKVFLW
ncbi:hypothetical protein D9M72_497850 [compost metagenome]